MKVYAISDLHLSTNCPKPMNIFGPVWDNYLQDIERGWKKVTKKDIVLIPGDISWAMRFEQAIPDLEYIAHFKGTKVMIKGNHDYWWSGISNMRANMPKSIYPLQNDCIKYENVIICGSRGWACADDNGRFKSEEDEKIYKREVLRMGLSLDAMERTREEGDVVIVMCHYPPFNNKYQSNELSKLFEEHKVNYVVYGHLHNYDKKQKLKFEKNGIKYFLTSCDLVKNRLIKICEV